MKRIIIVFSVVLFTAIASFIWMGIARQKTTVLCHPIWKRRWKNCGSFEYPYIWRDD